MSGSDGTNVLKEPVGPKFVNCGGMVAPMAAGFMGDQDTFDNEGAGMARP